MRANASPCTCSGRQFGTSSLAIHLKACKERWEREHGKPAPDPGVELPQGAELGSREWAAFNRAAQQKFNDETLQPCPHCARTFLPDRLAVHLRSCGKGHFADPKPRIGADAADEPSTQGVAFPSPRLSASSCKLGALARQKSEGQVPMQRLLP